MSKSRLLLSVLLSSYIVFSGGCSSDDSTSGNTADPSDPGQDIIAPAPVTVTIDSTDTRRPSVVLSWHAVGDDNLTGTADHYEIRYSQSPIDSDNWVSACDVQTLANTAPLPLPADAGTAQHYTITGPDTRPPSDSCHFAANAADTYYFAIRAVDKANNFSEIALQSVVSTDALKLQTTQISLSSDFKSDVLGGTTYSDFLTVDGNSVGDVDHDGHDDFVMGSFLPDAACLIYGADNLPSQLSLEQACDDDNNVTGDGCDITTKSSALRYTCLQHPGFLTGASKLASGIAALGDVNGDGYSDFALSGNVDSDTQGFVAVYLGRDSGLQINQPNIIVKGIDPSSSGNYFSFCGAGNFTGTSTSTGQPIDSIAIGEPGLNAIHVIKGDETWSASTNMTIDLDNLTGSENILTITAADTSSTEFGYLCSAAGKVLTNRSGLLVSHRDNPNSFEFQVLLFSGRDFSGLATSTIHVNPVDANGSGEDSSVVRLMQDQPGGVSGYPNYILGGKDVSGDGVADVIVTVPNRSSVNGGDGKSVFIFDGSTLAATAGSGPISVTVQGEQTGNSWYGDYGWAFDAYLASFSRKSIAVVDQWSSWSWQGIPAQAITTVDANTDAYIRLNLENNDKSIELGLFPYENIQVEANNTQLDMWTDSGDVDGDQFSDLIYGTKEGKIIIIH